MGFSYWPMDRQQAQRYRNVFGVSESASRQEEALSLLEASWVIAFHLTTSLHCTCPLICIRLDQQTGWPYRQKSAKSGHFGQLRELWRFKSAAI
jgi:hypothetical protein